ncbi:MAG TPA: Calx-beta domain-containing protein [Solirubrobacterales bacterium]|nr:Calx-beta domain-containing protein [Solirubrobacterales bacterium]
MFTSDRCTSASLSIRGLLIAAFAALLLLAVPSLAAALPAPTLFTATGGTGEGPGSPKVAPPSELWRVDPATGAVASVGNTGVALSGMAQDPTTGLLYGATNAKSPAFPLTLVTINPANGAVAPIGSFGKEPRIADISFDSLGRLFGWWDEPEDNLVSIDKATGTVTLIGDAGISTYGSGSAFDLNDTFWLLGEGEGVAPPPNTEGTYYTVDTNTGVPTPRGRLTPIDENQSSISAAAFDCARTTLYATVNNYGEPPANLVTVNLATGGLANKGTIPTGADALEWYCPQAFEFPNTAITTPPGKTITIPVLRGPRIKGAASVSFATQAGSAKAGTDFVATSGVLGFANNASQGTFSVSVKSNPKAGKALSFQVALSGPSGGGAVGTPVTVKINTLKPGKAKIKGPKSTHSQRPVFKLTSKQIPAKFRCKLDKGKFKNCGKAGKKPKKFKVPALEAGKHTLAVQIVNGQNKKSKVAKKKFTVLP